MKKPAKKIVISSVLKPINDVRLYHKIGRSLSRKENTEIHIAGFKAVPPKDEKITFYALFSFHRLSLRRFLPHWNYAILLLKVKPHIIICNTTELMILNSLYKILFGAEYYYNLEENYFRNIRYTQNFPFLIRFPLAFLVRAKELLFHPFVTHYLSAEETYSEEMTFIKKNNIKILNKYSPNPFEKSFKKKHPKKHFLYSGTIAEQYGIFTIIKFIKSLHKHYPETTLTIIGFCARESTLKKVKEEINDCHFISLIGGNYRVDHIQIINKIKEADFGIIAYLPNPSTENCFPTKLYEYLHFQLPIVSLTKNTWSGSPLLKTALIEIESEEEFLPKSIHQLFTTKFYTNGSPDDIYWESEEKKLFQILSLD